MSWRNLLVEIVENALVRINECLDRGSASECTSVLIASADAVYSPLRPVADTGHGVVKKLVSSIVGILSSYFVVQLYRKGYGEKDLREVFRGLEEYVKNPSYLVELDPASEIIGGDRGVEVKASMFARKALLDDLKEYTEEDNTSTRRRRFWRPDPTARIARLLREIGSQDPVLARALSRIVRNLYSY